MALVFRIVIRSIRIDISIFNTLTIGSGLLGVAALLYVKRVNIQNVIVSVWDLELSTQRHRRGFALLLANCLIIDIISFATKIY